MHRFGALQRVRWRGQVGGIQQERRVLGSTEPAVRSDLIFERGDLPGLRPVLPAHHQVGDVGERVRAANPVEGARIDVAVPFVPITRGTGPTLFEESVMPLCAPRIAAALKTPGDLPAQTLLTVDLPNHAESPTADWEPWLEVMGLADLRMKNTLRFTQYADAVGAAVAGQGVVIGRMPLLRELVQSGQLVAPFGEGAASRRGYFIESSQRAAGNSDAQDFVPWLRAEADAAQRG